MKRTKHNCHAFDTFMQEQIHLLQHAHKNSTAQNYQRSLRCLQSFLKCRHISFDQITDQTMKSLVTHLYDKGLTKNSVSFYMRNLRAVYNKAVKQKLTLHTPVFDDVYTGVDKTIKRAIDESHLLQIARLNLSSSSLLELVRDIFLFSFCMRGMAFVDVAYLRKTQLHNGYILYTRRKTGKHLRVKLEPLAQRIVDKYICQERGYLFPFLTSTHADTAYRQYVDAINWYNHQLKKLATYISGCPPLTSYTPRHTWATMAHRHCIPLSVISEALGHTTEITTRIYLKSLDDEVIDNENAKLVAVIDPLSSI